MLLKEKIRDALIARIEAELRALQAIVEKAREAATHEEAKPENEHDTRAVEASYLAAGQGQRMEDFRKTLSVLRQYPLRDFPEDSPVKPGALLELSLDGSIQHYFLLTVAGGYKVDCEGKTYQIVTGESKLGQALLDKFAGDEVEIRTNALRTYVIEAVS